MTAYLHFCAHLEPKSPDVYGSENCFDKTYKEKWNTFYAHYTLSVSVTVLDISEQTGANAMDVLWYVYIS
jgi:hypothetical protein